MKPLLLTSFLLLCSSVIFAQQGVAINTDNSSPDVSAILDVKSTAKGMLVPRMNTAAKTGIASPATSLLVFDTDTNSFWYFNGTIWIEITPTGADGNGIYDGDGTTPAGTDITVTDYINIDANTMFVDAANNRIGIGTATPTQSLDVTGNVNVDGNYYINNNLLLEDDGSGRTQFYHTDGIEHMEFNGFNTTFSNTYVIIDNGLRVGANGAPAATLDVVGTVKIVDGTQAAGRVLSSDATGNATWTDPAALSNDWSKTGNAGTTLGTNFVGTTDAQGLMFKTNGVQSGYLDIVNNNTSLGAYSLNSNSTGNYSVAIGSFSLQNNTTGSLNTAIGGEALRSNTVGNHNVATGEAALQNNTTGSYNVATGSGALQNNTIGDNNIATGYGALLVNNTGINNIATGRDALYNSIGSNNVAVGHHALRQNIVSDNVAIGSNSLAANTTGTPNVALGTNALLANTTGSNNVGLGFNALSSSSNGRDNIAIGSNALPTLQGGAQNIAIGTEALFNANGSYDNFAAGFHALHANTDGSNNIAIGYLAMNNNLTGYHNFAGGWGALWNNTSGYWNLAIGNGALNNNTTGNSNIGLGNNAGTMITTGDKNSMFGERANASVGNLTNATAIGANAYVAASNSLVLGSINGVNGATANVNVGIGTSAPTDKLHVVGTSGNTLRIVDGNQAAGRVLTSDANGNATWQKPAVPQDGATRPAFSVWQNGMANPTTGVITYNGTNLNQSGSMNLGAGLFTAPVSGLYHFTFSGFKDVASGVSSIVFTVNGVQQTPRSYNSNNNGTYQPLSLATTIHLTAGNTVGVYIQSGTLHGNATNQFTGYLIAQD